MMPPILTGAAPLLESADVLFCDIWGVVHDGVHPYPTAVDALIRFRARGGTVILITNAPMPAEAVATLLDQRRVAREAWNAIVTSGQVALDHVAANRWRRVVKIAYDFDNSLFDVLDAADTEVAEAEAIVCVGMRDHLHATPEAFDLLLAAASARGLPFVCANPDLVVDVGGVLVPCAGTLAQRYERQGGRVYWAGKPYAEIYRAAEAAAVASRGKAVDRTRILAVGDSARTDLKGAAAFGVRCIFIGSGIHREQLIGADGLNPEPLRRLLAAHTATAVAAMPVLAW